MGSRRPAFGVAPRARPAASGRSRASPVVNTSHERSVFAWSLPNSRRECARGMSGTTIAPATPRSPSRPQRTQPPTGPNGPVDVMHPPSPGTCSKISAPPMKMATMSRMMPASSRFRALGFGGSVSGVSDATTAASLGSGRRRTRGFRAGVGASASSGRSSRCGRMGVAGLGAGWRDAPGGPEGHAVRIMTAAGAAQSRRRGRREDQPGSAGCLSSPAPSCSRNFVCTSPARKYGSCITRPRNGIVVVTPSHARTSRARVCIAPDRLGAVGAVADDLRDHRVVERAARCTRRRRACPRARRCRRGDGRRRCVRGTAGSSARDLRR